MVVVCQLGLKFNQEPNYSRIEVRFLLKKKPFNIYQRNWIFKKYLKVFEDAITQDREYYIYLKYLRKLIYVLLNCFCKTLC